MKELCGYFVKIVHEGKESGYEIYSDKDFNNLIHKEMDEYSAVDDEYIESLALDYIEGVLEEV